MFSWDFDGFHMVDEKHAGALRREMGNVYHISLSQLYLRGPYLADFVSLCYVYHRYCSLICLCLWVSLFLGVSFVLHRIKHALPKTSNVNIDIVVSNVVNLNAGFPLIVSSRHFPPTLEINFAWPILEMTEWCSDWICPCHFIDFFSI